MEYPKGDEYYGDYGETEEVRLKPAPAPARKIDNGGIVIPEIKPTDIQSRAIAEIKDWFTNRSGTQPVFRLFGYAGTGKTTITKYAIADLGLSMFRPPRRNRAGELDGPIPDTFFGAFTGKASYVMRRHGTPAQTIHSMIYSVFEATEEQVDQAQAELGRMQAAASAMPIGEARIQAFAAVHQFGEKVRKMKYPDFGLNLEADVSQSQLIVLDEVSMVNDEMASHLLAFGKPILVLGDPGQLSPIKGEGAFTKTDPDVMLEEIHRQALGSPIIQLATMARTGQPIPMGKYSDSVFKMDKRHISASQLLRADQVICGLNATRYQLNTAMRAVAGFAQFGWYPTSERLQNERGETVQEKIICLKNQNSDGLINGMFLSLDNIRPDDEFSFSADITTEEGRRLERKRFYVYNGEFTNHYDFDKDRHERDWKIKKGLTEATYGWAITGHKAQGSQWKNVIVYDDQWGAGRGGERKKWLYTAITRAEEGLVILG